MQFSHVGWQISVKNVDFMANFTISRIHLPTAFSATKNRIEKNKNTNDTVALRITLTDRATPCPFIFQLTILFNESCTFAFAIFAKLLYK